MINTKQLFALVPDNSGHGFDWPALLQLLPELQVLARTPQDPEWHGEGDVLTHTRMVCEELLASADWQAADADRRFVLFCAALLHDIAKPSCTRMGERITSPGHSRRGAIDARILLWRVGVPFTLRERICRLVLYHQAPFFAIKGNRDGQSAEFIVRKLSWELPIIELAALASADNRGRICAAKQETLNYIELFRELASEEKSLTEPRAFANTHTRLMYCRTGGALAIDYPFYQNVGSKVIVMCGLPASGKNTWVAKHAPDLPVISFDDARDELGLKHGENAGAAVHLAIERAKTLLRNREPFVWNATHLSGQMRKKTLDLLYAYDAEVELVYLEEPESTIKQRNTKRNTTLTNATIDRMLLRWEVPLPTEAHQVRYLG